MYVEITCVVSRKCLMMIFFNLRCDNMCFDTCFVGDMIYLKLTCFIGCAASLGFILSFKIVLMSFGNVPKGG